MKLVTGAMTATWSLLLTQVVRQLAEALSPVACIPVNQVGFVIYFSFATRNYSIITI